VNGDAIIHRKVLDDGFVELIDAMGSEDAVVDAARVSFGKAASNYTPAKNDRLLRYLREHHHDTPFEMVAYKLRVRAPVLVWWHWVRHRMASYNFISGRYVPFEETAVHRVANDAFRKQSASNKQGSAVGEFIDPGTGAWYNSEVDDLYRRAFALYQQMLDDGVAREQARLVLPFAAVYYDAIVMMNARSLANFIKLRASPDAQFEIRSYAEAVRDIVRQHHPRLWSEA
jgi:thymidylate synthase (FAD)